MSAAGRIDRRSLLGAGAMLCLVPAAARAALVDLPRFAPALEQRFTAAFAEAKLVGGAITVTRDGRVAGFFPYGKASLPFDIPVTASTRFHIGSVGKHVTALAILQLAAAGKLSLDAPIGNIVSGLPGWIAAVPVDRLLGHTGGIPDYEAGFDWDRPFPREALLKALKAPAFTPGEAWSYSNSGYAILGWAIEAASGLPYADYVAQRLFAPAALPLARPDAAAEALTGRAEPYMLAEGKVFHAMRMEDQVSRMSDGGVLFAALDWAPWEAALAGNRLVDPAMSAAMVRSGLLTSGRPSGYGYGWFLDRVRGKPMQHHSGGVPGFVTFVARYPAERVLVAATFNSPPSRRLQGLLDEAVEAVAPGATPLGIPGAPEPSGRRDARLRAFLGGGDTADLIAPELALQEKTASRKPGPRIKGTIESILFLEEYPVAGGSMSRYRIRTDGTDRTVLAGWTPDDRLFSYR
jgi:D-alanyl-D-alanine carboxypeptidase